MKSLNRSQEYFQKAMGAFTLLASTFENRRIHEDVPCNRRQSTKSDSDVKYGLISSSSLNQLAENLAEITEATALNIRCNFDHHNHSSFQSHNETIEDTSFPLQPSYTAYRLIAPITQGNATVGVIDLQMQKDNRQFTTIDKRLVEGLADFIGQRLEHYHADKVNREFISELSRQSDILSMLQEVSNIMMKSSVYSASIIADILECLDLALPGDAALISIRCSTGRLRTVSHHSRTPAMRRALEDIVQSRDANGFNYNSFEPILNSLDFADKRSPLPAALETALLLPLPRMQPADALIAVGRENGANPFTTVDKCALQIVAGLIKNIPSPNQ